jgi:hypothetical protein
MGMTRAKKILIVHPEGNFNNNPNLSGIIELLCEIGYAVTILSVSKNFYQVAPCANASLLLQNKWVGKIKEKLCNSFENLDELRKYYRPFMMNMQKYDLVIGVDRQGVIEASLIADHLGAPYGFISYEIFFAEECGAHFKSAEIQACRNVAFVVTQDGMRAAHLCKENSIPLEKTVIIPVAGRGVKKAKKNHFLNTMLNISEDNRIALFAGALDERNMINEIVGGLSYWPTNWAVVLHGRYGRMDIQSLNVHGRLERLDQASNLFFSTEAIPDIRQMSKLIHSADLGIAFSKPTFDSIYTGNNIKYLGLSSGKISLYLQHGIPVLVNEIGEMSDYVREYQLGFVIDELSDIECLLKDYHKGEWQQNCHEFFQEKLDLNVTSGPLLAVISAIV